MAKWLFRLFVVFVIASYLTASLPRKNVESAPLAFVTITPNVFTDEYTVNGNCSLREALHSAMYNADYGGCTHTGDYADGHDTIILSHGTAYTLSRGGYDDLGLIGDLDIFDPSAGASPQMVNSPYAPPSDITIQGADSGSIINANEIDHAFEIMAGVSVLIDKVMIYNGLTQYLTDYAGGAIYVEGALKLTYSEIYGNTTMPGGPGGGIANRGTLTLEHVVIQQLDRVQHDRTVHWLWWWNIQ